MIRWMPALALLPVLIGVVEAEQRISLPDTPPPRISIARFVEDGCIEFLDIHLVHSTSRTIAIVINEVTYITQPRVTRIKPERVRAFNVRGNEIPSKDLASLLSAARPVLVSGDGRPVDPWYLKLVKDDTLIFASPALLPPEPSVSVSQSPPLLVVPSQRPRKEE